MLKIANEENLRYIAKCLVESIVILDCKGIVDGNVAINFIDTDNLHALQGYLEGIRLKAFEEKEGE